MKKGLELRRSLFWDINEKDIDRALTRSPEWVIPRVFEYGSVDEIFEIIDFYSKAKVKSALRKARLKPVASAMASLFLNLNLKGRNAA